MVNCIHYSPNTHLPKPFYFSIIFFYYKRLVSFFQWRVSPWFSFSQISMIQEFHSFTLILLSLLPNFWFVFFCDSEDNLCKSIYKNIMNRYLQINSLFAVSQTTYVTTVLVSHLSSLWKWILSNIFLVFPHVFESPLLKLIFPLFSFFVLQMRVKISINHRVTWEDPFSNVL